MSSPELCRNGNGMDLGRWFLVHLDLFETARVRNFYDDIAEEAGLIGDFLQGAQ